MAKTWKQKTRTKTAITWLTDAENALYEAAAEELELPKGIFLRILIEEYAMSDQKGPNRLRRYIKKNPGIEKIRRPRESKQKSCGKI